MNILILYIFFKEGVLEMYSNLSFAWLYNYIYILLIQIIIFLKIRRYNPKKENDLFDMLEN